MSRTDEAAESLSHPLTRVLLVLTFTGGICDAVSFLALGTVFTATMNGNILLLGFGIAGKGGLPVLAPLVSMLAFVGGAAVGGLIARRRGKGKRLVDVMLLEAALVGVAGVIALAIDIEAGELSAGVLIALLAVAMGMRSATVREIALPDLSTTLVTMPLVGLGADLGTPAGSAPTARRRIAAVVALAGGAVAGALLLEIHVAAALFAMVAVSLAATLAYDRAGSFRPV